VTVSSELGTGTTFHLYLPACMAAAAKPVGAPQTLFTVRAASW
jgi:hypothetical protein